jgi:hypothetical protein
MDQQFGLSQYCFVFCCKMFTTIYLSISVDGHLGVSSLGAIMNKAAFRTVCIFWHVEVRLTFQAYLGTVQ